MTENPTETTGTQAAFQRADVSHGVDCSMPSLLKHLAAPGCLKVGSQWDRCGVHYVEPIGGPTKQSGSFIGRSQSWIRERATR
jgi:hypothetical protein